MKFGSIVGGERLKELRGASDQGIQSSVHGGHGAIVEPANDGETSAALHEGDDAMWGAMSHDGVDFPMAKHGPVIDVSGPFGDVPLSSDSPSGIVGHVTFAALLGVSAKVSVQGPVGFLVGPDAAVDSFVADPGNTREGEGSCNLLRAPLLLEQDKHPSPDDRVDSQVSPGSPAATAGPAVRLEGSVGPIVSTTVASDLTADGAWVSSQVPSDVNLLMALPIQRA